MAFQYLEAIAGLRIPKPSDLVAARGEYARALGIEAGLGKCSRDENAERSMQEELRFSNCIPNKAETHACTDGISS